jgi:hypothetical protein
MISDSPYPLPFLSAEELEGLSREIKERGFYVDPFVGAGLKQAVCGLNVAVAWPFPAHFQDRYQEIAGRLAALDANVYVYPFAATHITLLTIVSFKRYPMAPPQTEAEIAAIAPCVLEFLGTVHTPSGPLAIDVGPPVLARTAAFFPIREPTGRLLAVRTQLVDFCRRQGGLVADASVPIALHSTVLRFRSPPDDREKFTTAFAAMARTAGLGRGMVDEVLVTLETKPYMRAGKVMGRVPL